MVMTCKNFTVEMDCYKARILWGRGQNALFNHCDNLKETNLDEVKL